MSKLLLLLATPGSSAQRMQPSGAFTHGRSTRWFHCKGTRPLPESAQSRPARVAVADRCLESVQEAGLAFATGAIALARRSSRLRRSVTGADGGPGPGDHRALLRRRCPLRPAAGFSRNRLHRVGDQLARYAPDGGSSRTVVRPDAAHETGGAAHKCIMRNMAPPLGEDGYIGSWIQRGVAASPGWCSRRASRLPSPEGHSTA